MFLFPCANGGVFCKQCCISEQQQTRAGEQQVGYHGTAGLICSTPVLYTMTPHYTHLQRTQSLLLSISLVFISCLLYFVSLKCRHKDTQCSNEGRAFVPGSQFALVLLCFTVQVYVSKQSRNSCFRNQLQDAFFSTCKHTQTHIVTHRHVWFSRCS